MSRQAYLDRVRGLAVLIMIEAHVLDSWTRVADRSHPGFGYAMMLGGLGAPLFLFLAGVAVVLSAESKYRRTGDFSMAWRAVRNRGWQVFGLAFLFRLQSYILTGGTKSSESLEGGHSERDGTGNRDGRDRRRSREIQASSRCGVRSPDHRDLDVDAGRAHDLAAELAARSGRMVFSTVSRAHQFHAFSLGRVRVCRGRCRHPDRRPGSTEGAVRRQLCLAVGGTPPRLPRVRRFVSAVHLPNVRVLDELAVILLPAGRDHDGGAATGVLLGAGPLARNSELLESR